MHREKLEGNFKQQGLSELCNHKLFYYFIFLHFTNVLSIGNFWRQSDRNETWVRVKGDPHLVLKIRSKYHVILKGFTSDL